MKSIHLQVLIGFLSFCLTNICFGQEEQKNEQKITAEPIESVPTRQSKADLSLLVPPQGFATTDLFNGYIHKATSSTIVMTLLEGVNYLKLGEGMTTSYYQENKLNFVAETKFQSVHKVKGKYYKCTFEMNGKKFIRYIVYAGDLNQTLWLHITFPESQAELVEPLIIESIHTIRIQPVVTDAK